MNCSLCPLTVRKALERIPGVVEARVQLDEKRAQAPVAIRVELLTNPPGR